TQRRSRSSTQRCMDWSAGSDYCAPMRWKLVTSGVPLRLGPSVTDLLVSVTLTVTIELVGLLRPDREHPFGLGAAILTVWINLPLLARRRHPAPVLVASSLGFAIYLAGGGDPLLNAWAPLIALCTLLATRARRPAEGAEEQA